MNKKSDPTISATLPERQFMLLAAASFACFALVVLRNILTGGGQYTFLLWNLFLAWLPYLFAWAITKVRTRIMSLLCGAAWLLVLPNAPYITTDFIHLMLNKHGYTWYNVTRDEMMAWLDIVLFFLVSLCGLVLGFVSQYTLHDMVKRNWSRMGGWLFVVAVSFLSGFGIYLGRFVRLNSWDIIGNPAELLAGVADSIHRMAFLFTLLYGMFQLIVYALLYSLTGSGRSEDR